MSSVFRKILEVFAKRRHDEPPISMQMEHWRDPVEFFKEAFPQHLHIHVDEHQETITQTKITVRAGAGDDDVHSFKTHEADYIEEALRRDAREGTSEAISEAVQRFSEEIHKNRDLSSEKLKAILRQRAWLERSMSRMKTAPAVARVPLAKPRAFSLLEGFRWFCGRDSREIVDLVLADLTRDTALMVAEGRNRWFIRAVVWRHVGSTLISVSWSALHNVLKKLAKTLGLIERISK